MARKVIDTGIVGNDGTGDSIRDSFRKVNENFRELYGALGLSERLSFLSLDETPDTFEGQENSILAVNPTESSLIFKQIVGGTGIAIDFDSNVNEITINNTVASISADTNPRLGGNLQAQSGGAQYRIQSLTTPVTGDEAANKAYTDTKISLAGVNARDPGAGNVTNTAFGTMTGPLILSRDPDPDDDVTYGGLIAATKRYVDNAGFGSVANLYVATSGNDARVGVGSNLQGRALSYAYRSLEAALKRAEEIIKSAPPEIGPYKKLLTYTNPSTGEINECTLSGIDVSPSSGSGFAGRVTMTIDTITLTSGGFNYQPREILKINISGGAEVNAATIEVLTVNAEPGTPNGPVLTFRLLTGGLFDGDLPGSTNVLVEEGSTYGSGATFNITYRVSTAIIEEEGNDYSLVSVRVQPAEGDTGAGGFGFADVVSGQIAGITITDGGTGFTQFPSLVVNLPRFAIQTGGFRTDFTGDVTTDSAAARRGRDIREGLYLLGETSGALAQILAHSGELDSLGNELFDVDIKYGVFQDGETISYGDVANQKQVAVFVETGIYYENFPLRVPQNVAIIGDEFRRTIIRPKKGRSTSPWAFTYFRRDRIVDGLNTAKSDVNVAREDEFGYHYLSNASEPPYPLVNNKGFYRSASTLLELNKTFIQEEVIAWINKQVAEEIEPFVNTFQYNQDLCKRDVGLLVDAMVYDLRYGGNDRTVSASLKYYQAASTLGDGAIAIGEQGPQTRAAIRRIDTVAQSVIKNLAVTPSTWTNELTDLLVEYSEPQIIDTAYTAEVGSGGTPVTVSAASRSTLCTITTASAHGLATGEIVTFRDMTGMTQLNNRSFWISVASPTQFNIYNDQDRLNGVNSTDYGIYDTNSGDVIPNGGVIGALTDVIIDIISNSNAVNLPLENDQMDVFLMNDATIIRAMTIQGSGGFALVLDPEGQILAKSPYAQEGAVFSKSTGRQTFAGGMYVDGFAGNLRFRITNKVNPTRLEVSELKRFPQLPASFIVQDQVYRINYVRDFQFNTEGSTATFVLDETTPWPFDVFTYNEAACNRDVGLIIDGLGYDIVFGSNYHSRKAALTYRQANAHVVVEDQLDLTIRAIDRAHEIADAEILSAVASPIPSRAIVTQSKTNFRNIVRRGTTATPPLTLPNPPGLSAARANAKALLLANMDFIKNETIGYINATYPVYDAVKCYRDVGLILEAVLNDLVFGTNYNSVTAGLAYQRNITSSLYVLSDQKSQTLAGINKSRDLALALITDVGIQTLITGLYEIVTDIIDTGSGSAPALTYPVPGSRDAGYTNAVAQIRANNAFLQAEITAWIAVQVAGNISPFTSAYTYNSATCARDVGLLIDAFSYDLMYGGNTATITAGNAYYAGAVISGQVEETIAAYGRLKTVIQEVIVETAVTRSAGNTETQDTSNTAGSNGAAIATGVLVDIVNNIIENSSVTAVPPTYSLGNTSYATARSTIIGSKETIQQSTIDYLEDNDLTFTYDPVRCARDVQYIVESLAYDLVYGGNSQTYDAAAKYYDGILNAVTQQIPDDQKTETVGAINYMITLSKKVIRNTAPSITYSATSQVFDLANDSDSTTETLVQTLLEVIPNTITTGFSYLSGVTLTTPNLGSYAYDSSKVSARTALTTNKSDIQLRVVAFVNDNANLFEVLMPGNRSMLSNDFTQINDMGYGLIATNGGLTECVSMFTYYNYTSYYSLNGGQIRSVGGSSAHGVYALAAEGSDPLEVPTAVDLYYELSQGATVYNDGGAYDNDVNGLTVYVSNYDYLPRDNSEIEVNHGGQIGLVRYPVVSATTEDGFPEISGKRIYRLNLDADANGLVAVIPDGTDVTLRMNTEIVLTGGVVGVAVRPSTALKLNETFDTQLYRVLEFADFDVPEEEYQTCSISISTEAVVTTPSAHNQLPGYRVKFFMSAGGTLPGGLFAGEDYWVLDEGFSATTFKISASKAGTAIAVSSGAVGTIFLQPTKLAATALKDGYNYAETTVFGRQPYVNYGATLIVTSGRFVIGRSYKITFAGTTNWVAIGAANNNVGTVFTASGNGGGTGIAIVSNTLCTFDHTSETVTITAHGFENGDVVRFDATGDMPSGLFASRQYFVYGKTDDTFQLVGFPGSTTVITFLDNGTGYTGAYKVIGRAGDSTFAIVELGPNDSERIVGCRFNFIGRDYVIVDYQSPDITGESYATITVNPPLQDSIINFESSVTLYAHVPARSEGSQGTLTIRISLTRVTGHDLLEIGTGSYADTNYPNEIYGAPVRIATETLLDTTGQVEYAQVVERGEGRCFFVTTDQFGNFSVGPFFRVDQGTGTVTFSASIALSNLNGLGFKRGVPIAEFSTDTSFSDNATDTVPTENATRGYLDRRLGVTHGGENVDEARLIPAGTGGFLAVSGQSQMKGNLNMGAIIPRRIINLADPVDDTDAVNKRSVRFDSIIANSFPGQATNAGYMIAFTGDGAEGRSVEITGDLVIPGDNAITTGVDSTQNQLNIYIKPEIIDNANISPTAAIAQSKLAMVTASTRANATGIAQADRGLASFNDAEFTVTSGWVEVKNNGVALGKIAQIPTDTVLGNSTSGTANVAAVTFATVVDEGGSIKKNQFTSQGGFIRRKVDATTSTQDSDYENVTAISAYSGTTDLTANDRLVIRSSNGSFGGSSISASVQYNIGAGASGSVNKKFLDTSTPTASTGSMNIYNYDGSLGIVIGFGSLSANKTTTYLNDFHTFRNFSDTGGASISASSITAQTFTTGGSGTAGTVTGNLSLSASSTFNADAGTLRSTTLSTGAAGTAGTITGTWSLGASSVLNADSGTLRSTTLSTGASGTAGTITGTWSLGASSTLNTTAGTLRSTTLSTGAAGTAGTVTGTWSLGASSVFNADAGTLRSTTLSTGAGATAGTITGNWSLSAGSIINVDNGTLRSTTLSTGSEGTAGSITGNWSMIGATNLTLGTGSIDARTGTLYADTLNTGASGTAGSVTGAWTIAAGSSFVATSIQSQANSATTTATNANTGSTIVLRDSSGNFSAGMITANLTGTVTGNVSGNAGTITSQANSATITATSANTANQIVLRDGSGNFSANIMTGTATAARYADLAERYAADKEYAPGTVVVFGGDKEITTSNAKGDTRVAGVISTNPAHLMNSEAGDNVTHPPVALQGRVPCRVVGKIRKGDILVCAGVHGVAIAGGDNIKVGSMIGKALEDYDSDHIGTIEIVVGRT